MKKTHGKVILKGKKFDLREAGPDHPIYQHGFIVGMMGTSRSHDLTQKKRRRKAIQVKSTPKSGCTENPS